MICTNCHNQIEGDPLTCPVCGKQLILDKAEASKIIGATVRNSVPASMEVVTEFMSNTADAAKDLQDYLSIRQQVKNLAAIQAQPILSALQKINTLPTDAKHPGEALLFSSSAVYGGKPAYMQSAKIELTPWRLIFYEHINTRSGLLNIVTAAIAPRYSFSIALKRIIEIKNYEVNYNPGHLLILEEDEQIIIQTQDYFRFDKALRIAVDTVRTTPNKVL